MTTAGSFSDASGSLFDGDYRFKVCYSKNAGTLVFSGDGHGGATQVYIITQNSNWSKIENSDKYLNPFQNPSNSSGYRGFGVVEQDDKIYLIGGASDGYRNEIQILNLQNSGSLQQAQTRQWTFVTHLTNTVHKPAVIHSNDQLLIVGYTGSSSPSWDVQYLSLASENPPIK